MEEWEEGALQVAAEELEVLQVLLLLLLLLPLGEQQAMVLHLQLGLCHLHHHLHLLQQAFLEAALQVEVQKEGLLLLVEGGKRILR